MTNVTALVSSIVLASTLLACGNEETPPSPRTTPAVSTIDREAKPESVLKNLQKQGRVSTTAAVGGTICD